MIILSNNDINYLIKGIHKARQMIQYFQDKLDNSSPDSPYADMYVSGVNNWTKNLQIRKGDLMTVITHRQIFINKNPESRAAETMRKQIKQWESHLIES